MPFTSNPRSFFFGLAIIMGLKPVHTVRAEAGFDPSFGDGGRLLIDISPGQSDAVRTFILTPAGKLLIGGTCVGPEGVAREPVFLFLNYADKESQ